MVSIKYEMYAGAIEEPTGLESIMILVMSYSRPVLVSASKFETERFLLCPATAMCERVNTGLLCPSLQRKK